MCSVFNHTDLCILKNLILTNPFGNVFNELVTDICETRSHPSSQPTIVIFYLIQKYIFLILTHL